MRQVGIKLATATVGTLDWAGVARRIAASDARTNDHDNHPANISSGRRGHEPRTMGGASGRYVQDSLCSLVAGGATLSRLQLFRKNRRVVRKDRPRPGVSVHLRLRRDIAIADLGR